MLSKLSFFKVDEDPVTTKSSIFLVLMLAFQGVFVLNPSLKFLCVDSHEIFF